MVQNISYEERFVSSTANVLEQHEIGITLRTDFDEYCSKLIAEQPYPEIGAPFDPELHNLNKTNAFWMIGRNRQGEIMDTQDIRLLDLGCRTLGDYSFEEFRRVSEISCHQASRLI